MGLPARSIVGYSLDSVVRPFGFAFLVACEFSLRPFVCPPHKNISKKNDEGCYTTVLTSSSSSSPVVRLTGPSRVNWTPVIDSSFSSEAVRHCRTHAQLSLFAARLFSSAPVQNTVRHDRSFVRNPSGKRGPTAWCFRVYLTLQKRTDFTFCAWRVTRFSPTTTTANSRRHFFSFDCVHFMSDSGGVTCIENYRFAWPGWDFFFFFFAFLINTRDIIVVRSHRLICADKRRW